MWPLCNANCALWLLLPLLLGLLTGWWAWARRPKASVSGEIDITPPKAEVVTPVAPLVDAKIDVPAAPEVEAPKVSGKGLAAAAVAGAGAIALTKIGIPAAIGDADDLLRIKGIGPKLNGVLNGLGVTRFDQIAAWTAGDVDKVDDHLESFKGRIGQEEWIPQAKLLSTGQEAEWERIYGTVKKAAGAAAGSAVALLAIGIPGAVGDPDDLLQIKGIGPKLKTLLSGLGITRFDQIAAWGANEIDKVDDHLGNFKNRITRDSWVEQAGLLAKGKIKEFEAKFGKLDSENK
jgi:predicted flap endonuclease-1-like 5' DNA nuclease